MTKKIKCERCNGQGLLRYTVECRKCKGKGVIWEKHINHSRPIRKNCTSCGGGTGKIRLRCRLCEGYGWYKVKEEKVRIGRKRWY